MNNKNSRGRAGFGHFEPLESKFVALSAYGQFVKSSTELARIVIQYISKLTFNYLMVFKNSLNCP